MDRGPFEKSLVINIQQAGTHAFIAGIRRRLASGLGVFKNRGRKDAVNNIVGDDIAGIIKWDAAGGVSAPQAVTSTGGIRPPNSKGESQMIAVDYVTCIHLASVIGFYESRAVVQGIVRDGIVLP
jgi:hypothetical protein